MVIPALRTTCQHHITCPKFHSPTPKLSPLSLKSQAAGSQPRSTLNSLLRGSETPAPPLAVSFLSSGNLNPALTLRSSRPRCQPSALSNSLSVYHPPALARHSTGLFDLELVLACKSD